MERVAAIPGGARGLGRAIALALAERGWRVAIGYRTGHRTDHQDAHATLRAVQERGVRGLALERDVADPAQAEDFVRTVEREMGRIDALVSAVGPYHRVPLLEETPESWREMFDTNLHPVFYLARAVAPGMQERGWGRILTFGLVNADRLVAQPSITAYYAAKVGVLVLTRALARVLAPHGITVNAISPGYIETESSVVEDLQEVARTVPAGRLGAPDDVVHAALYLLSDEASYVNGANIQVSGAWGV